MFELKRVQTEEEFKQEMKRHPPDLILSDHGLPNFDSLAALSLARNECPEIPFILVTGSRDEITLEALKQGADAQVFKDQLWLLRPKVERLLGLTTKIGEDRAKERIQRATTDAEEKVAQRMRALEATNEDLETFVYTVSHELRAPLRQINSYLEILQQGKGKERSEDSWLEAISGRVRHMDRLVRDLLSFSRLGGEICCSPVDLGDLVREARSLLQEEMAGRDIDWVIAGLPVVRGDPAMLRQVMVNLLSNALKFTRTRPRARIEVGCTETPRETICCVRDNGVGFDPQFTPRLFAAFQRLHSSREFEGTGIGLAIVRRVIERHGGRTWAESVLEGGASFYFSLPKVPSE